MQPKCLFPSNLHILYAMWTCSKLNTNHKVWHACMVVQLCVCMSARVCMCVCVYVFWTQNLLLVTTTKGRTCFKFKQHHLYTHNTPNAKTKEISDWMHVLQLQPYANCNPETRSKGPSTRFSSPHWWPVPCPECHNLHSTVHPPAQTTFPVPDGGH